MDAQTPLQEIFRQKLIGTDWCFGPRWGAPLTKLFHFGQSGLIENYSHPNEHSWQLKPGGVEIYDSAGAVMWVATSRYVENGAFCISLQTPRDAGAEFLLRESRLLPVVVAAEPPPPAAASATAASATALSPADFLFPKDLQITPTKFSRVRLVGSCMTALYHEQFQRIAPETGFDYVVFNYAGELAPPTETYDLQYVQLPLRSVLTDRIVWATRFHEDGFMDDVLVTGRQVIDAMLASALAFQESHGVTTFVSNFIVPQMSVTTNLTSSYTKFDIAAIVRDLNLYLATSLRKYRNTYLADVNGIVESIGKQYVLDDMINFHSHNGAFFREWVGYEHPARIEPIPPMEEFYTCKRLEFSQAVYDQILAMYRTIRQTDQVKAVIFDLDNTLWRGQIAEDYRAGDDWPSGERWPSGLWEAVQHLRARGILVSLCSKNDFETVQRDWDNAVRPRWVTLEDFVSPKINWRTKAENIAELCKEFSIKPKSVVFVDDNPVERAAVQAALPELRIIGSNPFLTRRILLWAPETQITSLTTESANREDMVRSQIVREENRATLSRQEFLQSLNCKIAFTLLQDGNQPDFSRIIELVNKTNQFNTTGKRWTQAEILGFISDGGSVLAFRVADRFTEYGLVGVLFLQNDSIIQFVMSCRVLGMDIELFAAAAAVTLLRAKQRGGPVTASLIETPDNAPCRDVFTRAGFTSDTSGTYTLPADQIPHSPGHIREA